VVSTSHLLDDLAWSIHDYMLEEATVFNHQKLVLVPVTGIAQKFERNYRTVVRRLSALKDVGLVKPLIKKGYITLYCVYERGED